VTHAGRCGVIETRRGARYSLAHKSVSRELPIKQEAERKHYLEAFRRAGLD